MAFWSLKKKKQTKPEKPEKQIKGPWNYQPPASFSPDKPSGPSSERIPLPFTGLEKQELNLYPKKQQSPAPPPEKKADPQPSNQDILEQIADLYLKGDTATIFRLIHGRCSSGFHEINALWRFVSEYPGCNERRHLLAAIDACLLNPYEYPRAIMRHLADLNYKISGEEVISIRCGCHAMGEVMFAQFLGYKKYQICTADDENTCPRCRKMDGKVFLLSEAQLGVNLPPFCDFCRCSIIVIDPSGE